MADESFLRVDLLTRSRTDIRWPERILRLRQNSSSRRMLASVRQHLVECLTTRDLIARPRRNSLENSRKVGAFVSRIDSFDCAGKLSRR